MRRNKPRVGYLLPKRIWSVTVFTRAHLFKGAVGSTLRFDVWSSDAIEAMRVAMRLTEERELEVDFAQTEVARRSDPADYERPERIINLPRSMLEDAWQRANAPAKARRQLGVQCVL